MAAAFGLKEASGDYELQGKTTPGSLISLWQYPDREIVDHMARADGDACAVPRHYYAAATRATPEAGIFF